MRRTPCGCSADGIEKRQIDIYRTVAFPYDTVGADLNRPWHYRQIDVYRTVCRTSIDSVGRDPVAVPEKIFGLTLILDFFDRCHSLVSLTPPLAAVDSLPTGRAETCRTTVRMRRGDYQSPVALWVSEAPSSNLVGAHPCVRPLCSRQTVPFIDTTVQTYYFAPLRGASLSCFAKKVTKEGDLGEALRLCCGNASTFRDYLRQPKFALPQDPLPRCA